MSPAAETEFPGVRRFRNRLFLAMMLVVGALTLLGIYLAQRSAEEDAQNDLQRNFETELAALHRLQELRNAAVADRCNALAKNPRIHAALEDNALDLLYPSAKDELRDLLESPETEGASRAGTLHARFYRFLDGQGAVLTPPTSDAGELLPNEQAQLAQAGVPQTMQTGYVVRRPPFEGPTVEEVIVVPIHSSETNEIIAALVLGFKPVEIDSRGTASGMKSGILVGGKLHLPALDESSGARLARAVEAAVARPGVGERSLPVTVAGLPHLLFFKRLNPQSNYPPAYEVYVYPLTELRARQRQLRWQILGAGGALLLGGFVVSNIFSRRLSQPVEKLAVVSEENRAQRQRAEAALQTTSEELQRSTRFSADASHQLKSPITVLRAGLDSLLAREDFSPEVYEEISSLIHQTYRLTGVVEDLLLLSRMDAGRLQLELHTVNLTLLVEEWMDDLRAIPDAANLRVERNLPADLLIAGEQKYTALVVQNLLDNARKYNRPGGIIRISAQDLDGQVWLNISNTGHGIPPEAQPFVFERFHRAGANEDVAGHGLGLNLARELVRLHHGELRLVRSDAEWTEFCVVFPAAVQLARAVGAAG